MKTRPSIVVAIVLSLTLVSPVPAEKVTIEVTGVVDIIRTNGGFDLDGSINLGSVMNGSCIYDAEATPQESDWNFIYPIISASINLGNYTFTYIPTPSDPHVGFRVGYDGGYHYSITSGANLDGEIIIDGVPQPFDNNAGGAFFDFMHLAIWSEEPDPGPPYNLPNPFPDFSVFDRHEFRLGFGYPLPTVNDYFDIYGEITSLTVVPEPATVLLLGLGAVMVRKRKQQFFEEVE